MHNTEPIIMKTQLIQINLQTKSICNVFKRTFIYATLTHYMLLTKMNFTFGNSFSFYLAAKMYQSYSLRTAL